jgi:hypothetical protein
LSFAGDVEKGQQALEREALTLLSTLSAAQQELELLHELRKRDPSDVASTNQLANDVKATAAATIPAATWVLPHGSSVAGGGPWKDRGAMGGGGFIIRLKDVMTTG